MGLRDLQRILEPVKPVLPTRNPIVFSTEARGLRSHSRPVKDDLPTREQKERAEIMSIAIAQPHRRGSDDIRLSEPLGRFCAVHKLREALYEAGCDYAVIIRQAKTARGFNVHGFSPAQGEQALTEKQIEAIREAAIMRERKANDILRGIMPRLPNAMEAICYDQREPSHYNYDIIRHGLWALSVHLVKIDRGINAEKDA